MANGYRPVGDKLNRRLINDFGNCFAPSGLLRDRNFGGGSHYFDVSGTYADLQQNAAVVPGVGRPVIAKGQHFIPSYVTGRTSNGAAPGSGWAAPTEGIYRVTGHIAVSGAVTEMYGGSVLLSNQVVSGTTSFSVASATGATSLSIDGIVHAKQGENINIGVRAINATFSPFGTQDTGGIAPVANIVIQKVAGDEPFSTVSS